MQPGALREIMVLCKQKGYHIAVDTSGHAEPSSVKMIMDLADLWLFDLKLMNDARHVEYTGVSNELALKNLETLARAANNIIIRFPLIPGITDDSENLEEISRLMKKLALNRIDILPYHAIAKEKYRRMKMEFLLDELKEPDEDRIKEVKEYFTGNGFILTK